MILNFTFKHLFISFNWIWLQIEERFNFSSVNEELASLSIGIDDDDDDVDERVIMVINWRRRWRWWWQEHNNGDWWRHRSSSLESFMISAPSIIKIYCKKSTTTTSRPSNDHNTTTTKATSIDILVVTKLCLTTEIKHKSNLSNATLSQQGDMLLFQRTSRIEWKDEGGGDASF